MAEKKTAPAEEVKETPKKKINPWKEDYVVVYIPKRGESDEDYQFVSINDHTFQIKKDVDVAVPRPVAVLLQQRNSAIKIAERAIKKAQEEFLNPHIKVL
jgi:hypothetical protein